MQELDGKFMRLSHTFLVTEKNKKIKMKHSRAHLSLEEVVEGVVCGLKLGHEQIVSEEARLVR